MSIVKRPGTRFRAGGAHSGRVSVRRSLRALPFAGRDRITLLRLRASGRLRRFKRGRGLPAAQRKRTGVASQRPRTWGAPGGVSAARLAGTGSGRRHPRATLPSAQRVGHEQLVRQHAAAPARAGCRRRAGHDLAGPVPHEEARPGRDAGPAGAAPEGGAVEHRRGVLPPGGGPEPGRPGHPARRGAERPAAAAAQPAPPPTPVAFRGRRPCRSRTAGTRGAGRRRARRGPAASRRGLPPRGAPAAACGPRLPAPPPRPASIRRTSPAPAPSSPSRRDEC
jgi:hypothetical protein